jgi:acyl dehydratase
MTARTPLYLESFTVGDTFTSAGQVITAEQIKAFAREFDPQPFHLDEHAARDTLFAGLAASGWHTAALTMRLLVDSLPLGNGLIGAGSDLRWPTPTRPGDELHVRSEVLEVKPSQSKPDRGIVVVQCDTLNQRGECVQRAISKLLVFRRA